MKENQGLILQTILHPMPNFRALHPTFEKLFCCVKAWQRAQKFGVRAQNGEIDPKAYN